MLVFELWVPHICLTTVRFVVDGVLDMDRSRGGGIGICVGGAALFVAKHQRTWRDFVILGSWCRHLYGDRHHYQSEGMLFGIC
jgi:hypothetical protein